MPRILQAVPNVDFNHIDKEFDTHFRRGLILHTNCLLGVAIRGDEGTPKIEIASCIRNLFTRIQGIVR